MPVPHLRGKLLLACLRLLQLLLQLTDLLLHLRGKLIVSGMHMLQQLLPLTGLKTEGRGQLLLLLPMLKTHGSRSRERTEGSSAWRC